MTIIHSIAYCNCFRINRAFRNENENDPYPEFPWKFIGGTRLFIAITIAICIRDKK